MLNSFLADKPKQHSEIKNKSQKHVIQLLVHLPRDNVIIPSSWKSSFNFSLFHHYMLVQNTSHNTHMHVMSSHSVVPFCRRRRGAFTQLWAIYKFTCKCWLYIFVLTYISQVSVYNGQHIGIRRRTFLYNFFNLYTTHKRVILRVPFSMYSVHTE